jgi:hypothetical protein
MKIVITVHIIQLIVHPALNKTNFYL